jgi:hypothetical protein
VKGLLVRLSLTDSEAEAALRVIEYFDALVLGRATVGALVRGTAALAECPAGIRAADRPDLRYDAVGVRIDTGHALVSSETVLEDGTRLWLEREGGPGPLDDMVLERMRLALGVLLPSELSHQTVTVADVALVETVLSDREPVEERAKALRRLGLSPRSPLTVVTIAARKTDGAAQAISVLSRSRVARTAHVASLGDVFAALVSSTERGSLKEQLAVAVRQGQDGSSASVPAVRVGIGRQVPGMDAHESWSSAMLALRFASARHPKYAVADVDELGSTVALAQVPIDTWRADANVRRLQDLAASPSGQIDLAVVDAVLSTGSLRQAAAVLHMHHSSVASRLARIEGKLGWQLNSNAGAFEARVALTGLVLLDSAELSGQGGRDADASR